jgi:hypothetical protein
MNTLELPPIGTQQVPARALRVKQKLTPVQLAYVWHQLHGGDETFIEHVGRFMRDAYAYAGPDAFILAQEVWHGDGELYTGAGRVNCWFIDLAAGPGAIGRFLALAPRPQPFVAFYRRAKDNILRVWPWARLERLYGRRQR